MLNYQERRAEESGNPQTPVNLTVGTVGEVFTDGITIRFAGEASASGKRYRYNKDVAFAAGDRVLLGRVAGSYIIICRY